MKRLFDIAIATFMLFMATPLLVTLAILIYVVDGRPVLFRHRRVGLNGKPFYLIKFRTMRAEGNRGPQITSEHDSRITRLGQFLRRYKLDELPQIFNVLCGDMAVVGPRPEVQEYVELFPQEYREILTVKPGITDPASLKYRDEQVLLASVDDPENYYLENVLPAKLAISLDYIKHQSIALDVGIIMATCRSIVRI